MPLAPPASRLLLLLAFIASLAAPALAQDDAPDVAVPDEPSRVAIVVKNRANEIDDAKVDVLEDLVAARLTDEGFAVIRREDVMNAVSSFSGDGANAGANQEMLDRILSDNTSAVRLAQNLSADYVLSVSMSTFGQSTSEFRGGPLDSKVTTYTLRTSVAVLDAADGASRTGEFLTSRERVRSTPGLQVSRNTDDIVDDLLADTALQVADVLGQRRVAGAIPAPTRLPDETEFSVNVVVTGLEFPELTRGDDGEYSVGTSEFDLQAVGVTVEVDGITIGSTPGPFPAQPGLHKLRLTREGFEPWEGTVNVRSGLPLTIAMRPTGEFRRDLFAAAAAVENLKRGSKLTDAEIERLEGLAEFLRNSEIKIGLQGDFVNVFDGLPALPNYLRDLWGGQLRTPSRSE